MKKIAIGIGALFALLIIAAVVIPFVVDVDKYRPRIVEEANHRLNGKLELGKLSLSLWGQVRIQIASLSLTDARGQSVITVQDAYFHVPFSSILSGSPALTLKMQAPVITLVKDKSGKLNVMSLMKDGKTALLRESALDRIPAASPPPANSAPMEIPAIAKRARIGIELRQAIVNYRDELTGLKTQVKDLNLTVRDLSVSRPTEIELWANLDTQMSAQGKSSLQLQGPIRVTATATPEMQDSKLSQIGLVALAKFEDIEILVPGVFHKKKGIPASIDLDITASEQLAKITKFKAQFFNAVIQARGQITQVSTAPNVNLDVESGTIELKPWSELLPALQSAELGGQVTLKAHAEGPSSQLAYRANLTLAALTSKTPGLKAQPRIDGEVKVSTDQIENFIFTLKAPGNDLKLSGKLVSFLQPKLQAEVSSGGLDLDQLMDFKAAPAGAPQAAPKKEEATSSLPSIVAQAVAAEQSGASTDALIASLRQNKILQAAQATVGINIRALKAQGIKISDILGRLVLKNLVATLDQFSMKLWGGSTKANLLFNLGAVPLATYKFTAQVENLDLAQGVSSQVQMLKNTMYGKAFLNMSGEGAGADTHVLMDRLKVRGTFKVKDAVFSSIDVGKMATEALNKGIQKVGEKIPAAKGKEIKSLPNRSSKYTEVSSDFTVSDGKFSAPNFTTKAEPNQGIDLKGETVVGLKDQSLKTRWEVIDTYNLTKAKDVSVDQGGVKVEHILAEGNGPVRFPVSAGCTLSQPCYSYAEVPEFLAKVALGNAAKALTGKAKSEAKKQVESVIEKSGLPEQFKGLGKKLFH